MSLIFVARLWRGWFSSLQRSERCTKRTRKIASSTHDRLVGCSVDRMAAHTKAAPDDSVLRLIDRALGKLNDSAGFSPRPGLVAQAPRPLDRRLKVVDLGTTPLGSLGSTPTPPPGSTLGGCTGTTPTPPPGSTLRGSGGSTLRWSGGSTERPEGVGRSIRHHARVGGAPTLKTFVPLCAPFVARHN